MFFAATLQKMYRNRRTEHYETAARSISAGAAGFLLANGALNDGDTVNIRRKLIEKDKVEAIIVLPRELFITADISVTLLQYSTKTKQEESTEGVCSENAQGRCYSWTYAHG